MELSFEAPDDTFDTFVRQKIGTLCPPTASCQLTESSDIIDSSKLNFSDDENWLYQPPSTCSTDLRSWLYDFSTPDDPSPPSLPPKSSPKNIDTRTFTRPKKRFTRPSIEKYNEELYGPSSELKELTDSGIQLNGFSNEDSPQKVDKPLNFDLGQASSSVYFENMLANAPMMDSFTNMSPPSLVNSMCSSTFTNLMESSFIKNDPVLREIRDTDFTGSILQQEAEPMFHSITESYSSLNSDVPEHFLKKVSFTEEDENREDPDRTVVLDTTFAKDDDVVCDRTMTIDDEDFHEAKTTNREDLNSTYPRSTKPETPLNSTFQRRKNTTILKDLNSTITLESEKHHDRTFENVKRLLDRRPSPSLDLNRLSYVIDKNDQLNATFTATESPKRNSFGSTDSGENLDYMSLSSSSTTSRSSRMQSTDGINVIMETQERTSNISSNRTFPDIMSTPKPRNKTPIPWPNHEISPIADRNSDPEVSSTERPMTVIPQNAIRKQKSVGHLNQKLPNPKSVNTMSRFGARNAIRGSHPNLKMSEPRTYSSQRQSNLNSMGHALKGSYTSLKPTNRNLPVAPPPLDTTATVKTPAVAQVQVSPVPRETSKNQDAQFVKPQPPRSCLPRPVTGIPRPVSRIPGPRNARPVSKSAGLHGPH